MSTFYKCDKCGKNEKEEVINFSFIDTKRIFFEDSFNRFELCKKCSKPLVVYINGYLANKKVKKKK